VPFVLVHGSGFAASCWDDVVPLLDPPVLAVDLPGRGGRPYPLDQLTTEVFADAVAEDIVAHDLHDIVLVGHSLAGITVPGVVERVGDRVRHVVFVAAAVPPHGQRVVDTLDPSMRALAEEIALQPPAPMEPSLARALFCDGMSEEQATRTLSLMVVEGPRLTVEPVSLAAMEGDLPRSWVRLGRDVVIPPERQDEAIARLGATVYPLDAGHMAMLTHPQELATILGQIAQRS